MINRREFCVSVGAMGVAASWPSRAMARFVGDDAFKPTEIKRGMWALMEQGGNVLLIKTKEGPVMIDAKFAQTGPALLDETRRLAGDAPAVLINTHHHFDHTGGNWAFKGDAQIIAHRNLDPRIDAEAIKQRARGSLQELRRGGASAEEIEAAEATMKRLETRADGDFTSTRQFNDYLTLIHGGVNLQMHHFGNGHTDNDVVIFLPDENVLHMGDLLFHKVHPYIDRGAQAHTVSWQHSVREAMKICNAKTLVIPGHGELTDKSGLEGQIAYFDAMRKLVGEAIAAGRSKEEVARLDPPEFKEYGFERLRPIALQAIYDEMSEG